MYEPLQLQHTTRAIIELRLRQISSAHNPLLKEARKAVARGTLTEGGLCVAESRHLLDEATRSGCDVEHVLVAESAWDGIGAEGLPNAVQLTDALFATVAATEASQGVISLIRPRAFVLGDVFRGTPLAVVLDGIQDPGNAGTILRAAEAFGATGAVFLKGTVNPWNPKALRASAGSVFRLPVVCSVAAEEFLREASERGVRVFAAMPRSARTAAEAQFSVPTAIAVGSEGQGVGSAIAEAADAVRIPTSGVESLNAAIAASILLYEAARQRQALA